MATVTLNGATAQDWIDNASDQGITLTLTAEPANETAVTYDGSNSDVFDATGRDGNVPGLGYQDGFLYGIGVNNTLN